MPGSVLESRAGSILASAEAAHGQNTRMRGGITVFYDWRLKTNETTWARLLAYVTGLVDHELLLQNVYLAADDRILKAHLHPNLRAVGPRAVHAGGNWQALGAQRAAASGAPHKPDTILGWYRKLVAEKFDSSKHRSSPDRPSVSAEIENLWSVWPAKTLAGVMIGLWERRPT
jgi:hypothetical protein